MVGGIVFALVAIALGVYAFFAIRCKGPLLSNPWIWMSKEEREKELAKVDIKGEYRQVAIVTGGLALALAYLSASSFFSFIEIQLPSYPLWIVIALVIVYAIGSSIKFAMRTNK